MAKQNPARLPGGVWVRKMCSAHDQKTRLNGVVVVAVVCAFIFFMGRSLRGQKSFCNNRF
ncbi:hypothetical protein AB9K35_16885 [Leisingera sp. XS_AS12]|uniref:hypothetical protein n=1 Tax=Leisingera sp. XS_AS12 TaxID=3241294 RepID=UPI0035196ADE